MESNTVVATFGHSWAAELARGYLFESGIPAWIEQSGLDDPFLLPRPGPGVVRLLVPADRLEEARALLAEEPLERDLEDEVEGLDPSRGGRPLWVFLAAALLLVGIVAAAIPAGLRVPSLAAGALGYLGWRRARRSRGR